jgi:hypothetical protein
MDVEASIDERSMRTGGSGGEWQKRSNCAAAVVAIECLIRCSWSRKGAPFPGIALELRLEHQSALAAESSPFERFVARTEA